MPEYGFYDHNDNIAYPLVTDGDLSLSGGGVLPKRGMVDAGFMLGLDSQFVPATHNVTLYSVTRSGSTLFFDFRSDAPGLSGYRWLFETPISAESGCIIEVDATPVPSGSADSGRGSGFLVIGDLSELVALGGGVHQLSDPPAVEPALLQSLVNTFTRSFNVANQARRCPPICDEDPPSPSAPTTFAVIQNLSGILEFKEGYNTRILVDGDTIEMGAVLGAGAGRTCEDIIIDEGGMHIDEECTPCDDYIRSVNGREIADGKLLVVGGPGVTVENDPANNRVTVTLETNRHCLEQASSSSSSA